MRTAIHGKPFSAPSGIPVRDSATLYSKSQAFAPNLFLVADSPRENRTMRGQTPGLPCSRSRFATASAGAISHEHAEDFSSMLRNLAQELLQGVVSCCHHLFSGVARTGRRRLLQKQRNYKIS